MTFPRRFISIRLVAFLLITFLLIAIEAGVVRTVTFSQQPLFLSVGVLFDLVFVTTGVFYWLVAKPLRLANSRLLLIALLMLRVALFILPQASLVPNQIWPFLVVFSEGLVLLIAGLRIRTIGRTYRNLRSMTDAETALRGSLTTVFGRKATELIIGEGLVLYYVLLGWRLRPDIPVDAQLLTTHRQSGQIALVAGLLMVGVIEGLAVHLLLARWHPTVAFWISLLSGYGMLFFVADILATVKRPSYLTANQLHLRLGIRWRATIPRSTIVTSLLINEKPIKKSGQLNVSFLTTPNVLLTFNEPICFLGPYGISKEASQLAFFVDNPVTFIQSAAENR